MLLLFETAAGYAVFDVNGTAEMKPKAIDALFATPDAAKSNVTLKAFKRFADTTDALDASSHVVDCTISKDLKKLLKKHCDGETLGVVDAKLGAAIKEKLSIPCASNTAVSELMRGVRSHMETLMGGDVPAKELKAMALGLAHSFSRYKLKFSPDKVDTMIIQAVSLLDDLDKELNNYVMRCREWYSWHFPEVGKIVQDHAAFAKCVKVIGTRQNAKDSDLSDILPEELETRVKEEAEMSMGTDISPTDVANIRNLCDQIISITEYRTQLHEYLKARMATLAPNVTALVGELVGGRLISHAGSLMNLAKYPASTIQILGAEKALFRALKTKRDTPKYGIIYHAQMLGSAGTKTKGKVARMLAAKVALATRVDALRETTDELNNVGIESRAYLEQRITALGQAGTHRVSGAGKAQTPNQKYSFKSETTEYAATAMDTSTGRKRKTFDSDDEGGDDVKPKPAKALKQENGKVEAEEKNGDTPKDKKKKKKKKSEIKEEASD